MKSITTLPVLKSLALVFLCFGGGTAVQAATLPQAHPYQMVLRDYLANLREADFEVPLDRLVYDPAYFPTDDDRYRGWLFSGYVPTYAGLRLRPSYFTLQTIEGAGGVLMNLGQVRPEGLAWWANWAYPGNPYYGSPAVKNRAFVAAAVDLMMLDAAHDLGLFRRSDFLGGTLIWLAYTYGGVRDNLPPEVQAAYEVGLRKFVDRLETWGPAGIMGDMDTFAVLGLAYTAQALGDAEIEERGKAYARNHLARFLHPAGYIDHGAGFDASYNGIGLYFMTWATLATGWDFLADGLQKMSRLKAYLTLPEPDRTYFFGPSHFSTSTSADSPNDQWEFSPPRDIGAAMSAHDALYMAFGGRSRRPWAWAVPDTAAMVQAVQRSINTINAALTPLAATATPWQETHWSSAINYAHDYYPPGFYEQLKTLRDQPVPELQPPFLREGSFIHNFEDTFLVAKFADYGVIIHTGRLSWWEGLTGFGGGALSAFWTPQAGPVLLGRRRGYQHDNPDRWDEFRIWPTHALSGRTPGGKVFTSARFKFPSKEYTVEESRAVVSVSGMIGDEFTAEDRCLRGDVRYNRRFVVEPEGLTVESTLTSDGQDLATELYETIPVFLRDGRYPGEVPFYIWFEVGGQWVEATGDLYENVRRVQVGRFGGTIRIEFDEPQRLRLSPSEWSDTYQSRAICRNILVDLLGSGGKAAPLPARVAVRYRITVVGP